MSVGRSVITVSIIAIVLLAVTACGPGEASSDDAAISGPSSAAADAAIAVEATAEGEAVESGAEGSTEAPSGEAEAAAAETASAEEEPAPDEATSADQAQSSEEDTVVDVTPMSEEEPAPPGASEPGAAEGDAQDEPPGETVQPVPGDLTVYSDSTYGFSVAYPSDYAFLTVSDEKLAPLDPRPVAAFAVMNPVLASSDIVELEPADLEIRVHPAEGAASLEEWLGARGYLGDASLPAQPFQGNNVSGLEVCAATMIAPGCSYFVLGNGWVYQMVPASIEGETIMRSFALAG